MLSFPVYCLNHHFSVLFYYVILLCNPTLALCSHSIILCNKLGYCQCDLTNIMQLIITCLFRWFGFHVMSCFVEFFCMGLLIFFVVVVWGFAFL